MGGKSTKVKTPKPKDYIPLVREQAKQNRVNTNDPYSSTKFSQNPDGTWTSNTGFSDAVQPIFQQQLSAALDPYAFNQQVSDASFNKAWGYLQPIQEQQTRRFEQQMADRGLPIGQEAYNDASSNLMRNQSAQQEQAALAAILAGENSANNAFNRMGSITGRGTATQAAPVDVNSAANMAFNANNQTAANNQAKKSSTSNAAATLGGAAMLSDERLKCGKTPVDLEDLLYAFDLVRIDYWKYIGEDREHIGTYAQDFKEAFGVGEETSIHTIDAIGVLMGAVKALSRKVRELEERNGLV